jgi:hypothetical protein
MPHEVFETSLGCTKFIMKTGILVVCSALIGALMPALAAAGVIVDWNNQLLQAVKETSTNPPNASRAMAMTSAAVFDAVNSIEGNFKPYHFTGFAAAGASAEAAAAQAAHDVMLHLFPTQSVALGSALSTSLAGLSDPAGKAAGVALGAAAAQSIIELRSADGANTTVPYLPGSDPGQWRPTPPGFKDALLPNWPTVTPFAMTSGDQFRASGPPALTSQVYAQAHEEVRLLGAADSATRTVDQTQIARFWADGAGTITPPGHWNQIAQTVAQSSSLSLVDEARLFALLNIAEADAAILCWDTKYFSNFWRPITAIREADTDGNLGTVQDAAWEPLLTTPNFPSYTSGHASFSGAAAALLAGFIGGDLFEFTVQPDESVAVEVGPRSFKSFSQAAGEAADSRLYGGIHFGFDNADGLAAGVALGQYVLNSQLQPVPEPATWALYGLGMLTIVGRRRVRGPARR